MVEWLDTRTICEIIGSILLVYSGHRSKGVLNASNGNSENKNNSNNGNGRRQIMSAEAKDEFEKVWDNLVSKNECGSIMKGVEELASSEMEKVELRLSSIEKIQDKIFNGIITLLSKEG